VIDRASVAVFVRRRFGLSMEAMRQNAITEVLSADSHFAQEGWMTLL
jgi:hypothetical protein